MPTNTDLNRVLSPERVAGTGTHHSGRNSVATKVATAARPVRATTAVTVAAAAAARLAAATAASAAVATGARPVGATAAALTEPHLVAATAAAATGARRVAAMAAAATEVRRAAVTEAEAVPQAVWPVRPGGPMEITAAVAAVRREVTVPDLLPADLVAVDRQAATEAEAPAQDHPEAMVEEVINLEVPTATETVDRETIHFRYVRKIKPVQSALIVCFPLVFVRQNRFRSETSKVTQFCYLT